MEFDQLLDLRVTTVAPATRAAGADDFFHGAGAIDGDAVGNSRLSDLQAVADNAVDGFRLGEHGGETHFRRDMMLRLSLNNKILRQSRGLCQLAGRKNLQTLISPQE